MSKSGNKPKRFILDSKFPERVKKAMAYAKCTTNAAFAKKCGLKRMTIGNWLDEECPQKQLDALLLFDVADRLGIRARWLALGTGDMLKQEKKVSSARENIEHAEVG